MSNASAVYTNYPGFKPKFDIQKCKKCIYSGKLENLTCCDYSLRTNKPTLTSISAGKVIDRRGEDYENCKLFTTGKRRRKDIIIPQRSEKSFFDSRLYR